MSDVTLISFAHVWLRNRKDYLYECTWSDGSVTMEGSLPWGRLAGVIDLGFKK